MTVETALKHAVSVDRITGLTLWRTFEGRWQASIRRKDGVSWNVVTLDDPVEAVLAALSGKKVEPPPAPVSEGFGVFG
jgi:hypothetical protein